MARHGERTMRRLLTGLLIATSWCAGGASGPAASDVLDALEAGGSFEDAGATLGSMFDAAARAAPDVDADFVRDLAEARRLVAHLAEVASGDDPQTAASEHVRGTLRFLRDRPKLRASLVFLVDPADDVPAVYALLDRLRDARGSILEEWASLVAAVCVVHDRPMVRRINENVATSADPIAIFDYYVAHERRLFFGVRPVPAELLVHLVDTTASLPEMAWALEQHQGDRAVGARFFDIAYDQDHLRGEPKKSTVAGWTLQNIRRYGGVCADQAYYAMTVAKAIGVPATYVGAVSGEGAHAWVGFLQSDGRRVWWNFDTGRYDAYQGVRGRVLDPQTRRQIPDSTVSLLAELSTVGAHDRQVAAALTDLARRRMELDRLAPPPAPKRRGKGRRDEAPAATAPPTDDAVPVPAPGPGDGSARASDVGAVLDLLEAALRRCPGHAPAWAAVSDLSAAGHLTLDDKTRWATVLHRLCGERYPDFSWSIIRPMIEGVADVEAQNGLWNRAFDGYGARLDIAADVRLAQGRMWERAGDTRKAGQCYEDVIIRFANAGPFVLSALLRAEAILRENGRSDLVVALYGRAWNATKPPSPRSAMFLMSSNWYRIGSFYAQRLAEFGRDADAASVGRRLRNGR
ncbi:MAG: transglutaminase domain-containing protein [Phycisphaerales bacterium]|nr:transglutaminase domain-containing protein [Phycisphaerales bacterium]